MDCYGGNNVSIASGFWREDLSSESIYNCPHPEACLGGFYPENENPVNCKEGY